MKREIIRTSDGSTSIRLVDWDENYHSKHGAIQEARHVFIQNGLNLLHSRPIAIMEIGFGTGLNAFITYLESQRTGQQIDYVGVEAYPVQPEEISEMNYAAELGAENQQAVFNLMHTADWETEITVCNHFTLTKRRQFFNDIDDEDAFDLIYFDAFGFRVQPELWSLEIFQKMYASLKKEGILVTYAARGIIKRNMIEAGFEVEKLAGPPGKREMFRARKH